MKRCPQCGKEYGDDVTMCGLDHNILEPVDATSGAPDKLEPVPEDELPWNVDAAPTEEAGDPAEFVWLTTLEPFEADRLLNKLETEGIPFQIDRVEQEIQNRGGVRSIGYIQVFVRRCDKTSAFKIFTADWKV